MFEIDLHHMNYDTALKIFVQKYNSFFKQNGKVEIRIIHGYGAGVLDGNAVIRENLRKFLAKNRDSLSYRLDMNLGVTYVTPKTSLKLSKNEKKRI